MGPDTRRSWPASPGWRIALPADWHEPSAPRAAAPRRLRSDAGRLLVCAGR